MQHSRSRERSWLPAASSCLLYTWKLQGRVNGNRRSGSFCFPISNFLRGLGTGGWRCGVWYVHRCQEGQPGSSALWHLRRVTAMLEWGSRGVVRGERSEIRSDAEENQSGCELLSTCPAVTGCTARFTSAPQPAVTCCVIKCWLCFDLTVTGLLGIRGLIIAVDYTVLRGHSSFF